jgi:hypothetical protein
MCREVFAKKSNFTEEDLQCIKTYIEKIKAEIKLRKTGPRIEKGAIIKPSRPLFGENLQEELDRFTRKLIQIENERKGSPISSTGSNGGANVIHTGPRGGKYIIHKNKKVYI